MRGSPNGKALEGKSNWSVVLRFRLKTGEKSDEYGNNRLSDDGRVALAISCPCGVGVEATGREQVKGRAIEEAKVKR